MHLHPHRHSVGLHMLVYTCACAHTDGVNSLLASGLRGLPVAISPVPSYMFHGPQELKSRISSLVSSAVCHLWVPEKKLFLNSLVGSQLKNQSIHIPRMVTTTPTVKGGCVSPGTPGGQVLQTAGQPGSRSFSEKLG